VASAQQAVAKAAAVLFKIEKVLSSAMPLKQRRVFELRLRTADEQFQVRLKQTPPSSPSKIWLEYGYDVYDVDHKFNPWSDLRVWQWANGILTKAITEEARIGR
jgi:hypothetical protein